MLLHPEADSLLKLRHRDPAWSARLGRLRSRVGQAHGATRLALQRAMYRASVQDEVAPCPWLAEKELGGKHVRLESIAGRTRRNDVARRVGAALRQRVDVVEGCARVLEPRATVDTTATAVAHRGELERSLVLCREQSPHATKQIAGCAWCAGETDAVTVSSGQFHLAGKDDTPRREMLPRAGCRATWSSSHRRSQHVRCARRDRNV